MGPAPLSLLPRLKWMRVPAGDFLGDHSTGIDPDEPALIARIHSALDRPAGRPWSWTLLTNDGRSLGSGFETKEEAPLSSELSGSMPKLPQAESGRGEPANKRVSQSVDLAARILDETACARVSPPVAGKFRSLVNRLSIPLKLDELIHRYARSTFLICLAIATIVLLTWSADAVPEVHLAILILLGWD